MQTHATTPFGRRSMSLGMIATQIAAQGVDAGTSVHKWHVFQTIKEARIALGATDRALAILDALLSFHPETALYGDAQLIVWPSNEQLIARANGMSAATLRRHLANLVACGLVIRRDSPNGKRFARKGEGGVVENAFGFDLTPLVARAEEFKNMAAAVKAEKKAYRLVKERLTICRRDIVKMIETGIDEGVPGNWGSMHQRYQAIVCRLPRTAPLAVIEDVAEALDNLRLEIREILESFVKSQNMSANESHNERHIQNSNPEPKTESEHGFREKNEASGSAGETSNVRSLPKRDLPLGIVLEACPNVLHLAQGGEIRHWRDFLATAELIRPVLGISPSAWVEAKQAMDERHAAITLAAIYQRSDQINNAGGYLRSLTERAGEGKFSTWPMIMALLNAGLKSAKPPHVVAHNSESRDDRPAIEVSDTLMNSLRKPRK